MTLELLWGCFVVTTNVLFIVLSLMVLRLATLSRLRMRRGSEDAFWSHKILISSYIVVLLAISIFATSPSYIKDSEVFLPFLPVDAPFSPSIREDYPDFTLVTFSSDGYTDPLENLIGSLHVWATGVPVVVYDLGMSTANRQRIEAIQDVLVVAFNFSAYPKHVQFMNNYAFKPLLLLDAVHRFGNIMALDAGIEVRSSLRHVFENIRIAGYFFVEASDVDPLSRVHPTTVAYLNMFKPNPRERQCYAGMHGYLAHSYAVREVLLPTVRCGLDWHCIDPQGAGHDNHRYEQAVFSLYMRQQNIHCHLGRRFNEHLPATLHPDALALHQAQVFFLRRWRYPKPYAKYVRRREHTGWAAVSSEEMTSGNMALKENGVTDRKKSDSQLLRCLREHDYELEECKAEQAEWRKEAAHKSLLGSQELRKAEEVRGYVLGLAAKVFWYWPISLGLASYIFLSGIMLMALQQYWQYKHAHITVAALVFVYMVAHHMGSPQFCREFGNLYFGVGLVTVNTAHTLAPSNLDFNELQSFTECEGESSRISYTAPPIFFQRGSEHFVYFESAAFGFGLIHYGIPALEGPGWMYMGLALLEPFLLERPCFFSDHGHMYMMPHTPTMHRILLYTTHQLPRQWYVIRDLLSFQDEPVSPSLHKTRDGWWYLLVRNRNDGLVASYRARSLLHHTFLPVSAPQDLSEKTAVCDLKEV